MKPVETFDEFWDSLIKGIAKQSGISEELLRTRFPQDINSPLPGTRRDITESLQTFQRHHIPVGIEMIVYLRGPVPPGKWVRFLEWLGRKCFKKVGFEKF